MQKRNDIFFSETIVHLDFGQLKWLIFGYECVPYYPIIEESNPTDKKITNKQTVTSLQYKLNQSHIHTSHTGKQVDRQRRRQVHTYITNTHTYTQVHHTHTHTRTHTHTHTHTHTTPHKHIHTSQKYTHYMHTQHSSSSNQPIHTCNPLPPSINSHQTRYT